MKAILIQTTTVIINFFYLCIFNFFSLVKSLLIFRNSFLETSEQTLLNYCGELWCGLAFWTCFAVANALNMTSKSSEYSPGSPHRPLWRGSLTSETSVVKVTVQSVLPEELHLWLGKYLSQM